MFSHNILYQTPYSNTSCKNKPYFREKTSFSLYRQLTLDVVIYILFRYTYKILCFSSFIGIQQYNCRSYVCSLLVLVPTHKNTLCITFVKNSLSKHENLSITEVFININRKTVSNKRNQNQFGIKKPFSLISSLWSKLT